MNSRIRTIVNEAGELFDGLREWIMEPALQLSKLYPDGQRAYFDRRIFEFVSDWQKKSTLAATWITAGMKFNLQESEGIEWLEKFHDIAAKVWGEESTLNELREFLPEYFKLWQLVKFRDESTQQQGTGWTLEEIALICIYTGEPVNPQTAGEILKKFNPALTSGRKLREVYNRLIHPGERIRLTENKPSDLKRARNMTRVIQYLEQNNHKTDQARQELGTLQNNINRHYS